MNIARELKSRRQRAGAVTLESAEVRVQFNEDCDVEDLLPSVSVLSASVHFNSVSSLMVYFFTITDPS